ncbi:hypothetical protein HQ544_00350 [Candidatus Falkowbacteria bacterium]|nr:hypothetical protein [Candidatus Falkowbacteria bacterium]
MTVSWFFIEADKPRHPSHSTGHGSTGQALKDKFQYFPRTKNRLTNVGSLFFVLFREEGVSMPERVIKPPTCEHHPGQKKEWRPGVIRKTSGFGQSPEILPGKYVCLECEKEKEKGGGSCV